MTNPILAQQVELRARLSSTLQQLQSRRGKLQRQVPEHDGAPAPGVYDVLVSPNEVIERHGTGAVLLRIFATGRGFLSIRSRSQFGGHQRFGDASFCIAHPTPHADVTESLLHALEGRVPRRIISVPYFPDDVASTIALKNRFGVPLCTYIMDDQSLLVDHIPRALMHTLLSLSDLRLGISQDLCEAYEAAYGFKFWFAPPIVPASLVLGKAAMPADVASRRGVVLGNIWSQQWLDRLRQVTRQARVHLDWFGNPNREWLSFEESDLARDGISFMGYVPEEELVARLRQYPYAVLPTAISDDVADRPELARLSLPSRITYLVATANTPIIVLGRADSATARFLESLDIGVVAPYRPTGFLAAVDHLCRPEVQQPMRIRAARAARILSAEGMAEWIWTSLARGEAADSRFEDLMPRPRHHSALLPVPSRGGALQDANVVITGNEVTDKHGTGALVRRIFATAHNVLSIRSFNHYGGDQRFGDVSLCWGQWDLPRPQFFRMVAGVLRDTTIRRIFCVPYFREEILTALALKDIYDVPLAAYIMDDQNVAVDRIPDALMREFLARCALRLATHPELRDAYEDKFGLKFWLLPAVVPDALILSSPEPPGELAPPGPGALLGSLWSERWFDMLWRTIHGAGVSLDWYGNPTYEWLHDSPDELRRKGINPHGLLAEGPLVERLRGHPFVVVPAGTLDDRDDRPALGLSLPGRIIFAMATANTPVVVLGSPRTSAARFVERFQIGAVCDYDPAAFRRAVEHLCRPDVQLRLRENAARAARAFSDAGITDWVWQSLERGEPADSRFEALMPRNAAPAPEPEVTGLLDADVVITSNEVTERHGTGALVRRIFATDDNVLSIRSFNHYGGDHRFGAASLCWNRSGLPRPQLFRMVAGALRDTTIRRIFCVPYFREEILTALALKDIYDVPMAAYIMDDQNVAVDKIPDALMREFLGACTLRLATHPEMRDAYEDKFGLKFWLLPAVVPDALILSSPEPPGGLSPPGPGALLGSLWSERWFDMLWRTVHGAGAGLDWYGNSTYEWLRDSSDALRRKGITPRGLLAAGPLVARLRTHPYVVVPAGTLDDRDDRHDLGLSLPGRIIFAMATANTPVIVLGSPRTSAARFVERFQIGAVCDYDPAAFRRAVEHLCQPDVQLRLRENAARVARGFSDAGITGWVWSSLERGEPDDSRFEDLMPRSPGDMVSFIEPPVPPHIYHHYIPVYHVMRRLRGQGMRPDFIIDVGASHGIWSYAASRAFPETRFILIDPLLSRYDRRSHEVFLEAMPRVETLDVAVSNRPGRTTFQVSHDLWGSSLLNPADFRSYESIEVEVDTLDNIARTRNIAGRGLLKLDVQCAEHLVLEGARELLSRVDGVVVEVSLVRYDARALVLTEMLHLLDGLGYRYYDETGVWRSPTDGTLLQKEIVFLRKDLFVPTMSRAIAP